jgi:hypothetical protein
MPLSVSVMHRHGSPDHAWHGHDHGYQADRDQGHQAEACDSREYHSEGFQVETERPPSCDHGYECGNDRPESCLTDRALRHSGHPANGADQGLIRARTSHLNLLCLLIYAFTDERRTSR